MRLFAFCCAVSALAVAAAIITSTAKQVQAEPMPNDTKDEIKPLSTQLLTRLVRTESRFPIQFSVN